MGTKANPGEFDCHGAAGSNEPIFTLRARDPLAPILVRLWVQMRRFSRPIYDEPDREREHRKRNEAIRCANEMDRWHWER